MENMQKHVTEKIKIKDEINTRNYIQVIVRNSDNGIYIVFSMQQYNSNDSYFPSVLHNAMITSSMMSSITIMWVHVLEVVVPYTEYITFSDYKYGLLYSKTLSSEFEYKVIMKTVIIFILITDMKIHINL